MAKRGKATRCSIARKAGKALARKRGKSYMAKIGRKGGKARHNYKHHIVHKCR